MYKQVQYDLSMDVSGGIAGSSLMVLSSVGPRDGRCLANLSHIYVAWKGRIPHICGYIQVNVGVCVWDATTNHGHVYHSTPVALVHSATAGTPYRLHVCYS